MFFIASAWALSAEGGRLAAALCISASCSGLILAIAAWAALMASGFIASSEGSIFFLVFFFFFFFFGGGGVVVGGGGGDVLVARWGVELEQMERERGTLMFACTLFLGF